MSAVPLVKLLQQVTYSRRMRSLGPESRPDTAAACLVRLCTASAALAYSISAARFVSCSDVCHGGMSHGHGVVLAVWSSCS